MKIDLKRASLIGGLLVAFSFVPCTDSLKALEAEPVTQKEDYPKDFASNFIQECVSHANEHQETSKFIGLERVEELCSCALEQFQANHTYSEYQALSWEDKEKAGYACVDRLVYEE